jgi:hypothetical protein
LQEVVGFVVRTAMLLSYASSTSGIGNATVTVWSAAPRLKNR